MGRNGDDPGTFILKHFSTPLHFGRRDAVSQKYQNAHFWLIFHFVCLFKRSLTVFIFMSILDFGMNGESRQKDYKRLQGPVHNMNQFIRCLRRWKHFAIWDFWASSQNDIIWTEVHQALWKKTKIRRTVDLYIEPFRTRLHLKITCIYVYLLCWTGLYWFVVILCGTSGEFSSKISTIFIPFFAISYTNH